MADKNKRKAYQGFVFALKLTNKKLIYTFCRLVPLSWVKLADVDCLRASFLGDIFPQKKRWHRIFRNRYWFSALPGSNRKLVPFYVIETRDKHRRIFLRMDSAFHYRVRSALGRVKSEKNFD